MARELRGGFKETKELLLWPTHTERKALYCFIRPFPLSRTECSKEDRTGEERLLEVSSLCKARKEMAFPEQLLPPIWTLFFVFPLFLCLWSGEHNKRHFHFICHSCLVAPFFLSFLWYSYSHCHTLSQSFTLSSKQARARLDYVTQPCHKGRMTI